MNRVTIAEDVAERLYRAEISIDRALGDVADFIAILPRARSDAALAATTGQRAFDGAAGAVVALTRARGDLVSAHEVLGALARKMRIDVTATGPIDKPDDDPPIGGGGHPPSRPADSLNKVLPLA